MDDPLEARAGELFFREQKATVDKGQILLADLERVEMHASGGAYGSLGRLIVAAQTSIGSASLDVLDDANGERYWERDQQHDFVIGLNHGRAALAALARVIERWIAHFLGVAVKVAPLRQIEEPRWAWHIGLDAQSTAVLNDLWHGAEVEAGGCAACSPSSGSSSPSPPPCARTSPAGRCTSRSGWTSRTSCG